MVLVSADGCLDVLPLPLDLGGVVVAEAVAFVPQPQADGDGDAQPVGPVEERFAVSLAAVLSASQVRMPLPPQAASTSR